MQALIEVFRMHEISKECRVKIIKQLGELINHQYGMNLTEPLVYELVNTLDPTHIHSELFLQIVNQK